MSSSGGVRPRWFTDHGPGHARWYIERFRRLAAEGADLAGEARLVDALVAPGSRILDAGCGTGRVGAELFRRGHSVVGVDVDPELVAAAVADHPGPTWLQGDLAGLELHRLHASGAGELAPFDAAVLAGNVLPFLAPGSAGEVLRRLAAVLRPDGVLAVGFGRERGYSLSAFDADASAAGFALEHRFATWDLRPWTVTADFAVTILRRP